MQFKYMRCVKISMQFKYMGHVKMLLVCPMFILLPTCNFYKNTIHSHSSFIRVKMGKSNQMCAIRKSKNVVFRNRLNQQSDY